MQDQSIDEERRRRRKERMEEELREISQHVQQSPHLHGRPLDIADDDDEWMANHVLRNAGYPHPLIDRRNGIDAVEAEAAATINRMAERLHWLRQSHDVIDAETAAGFNRARGRALEQYRKRLEQANRLIFDFNLMAPDIMHRRLHRIDDDVARAELAVPELEAAPPPPRPSLFERLRGRR